jgi:hypothetical protein
MLQYSRKEKRQELVVRDPRECPHQNTIKAKARNLRRQLLAIKLPSNMTT